MVDLELIKTMLLVNLMSLSFFAMKRIVDLLIAKQEKELKKDM